jgi:hypothetical protein
MDDVTATGGLARALPPSGLRTLQTVARHFVRPPWDIVRELVTTAPAAAQTAESLEPCVCGHPPHPASECDGGCGCATFEPDNGRGWVRVNYIFNATSIQPQGPYPFGKAS